MHEGHRQRMLFRLEQAEDSLQEHELLEILLFNAIPRKNTNELAHSLLNSFGSIANVLHAEFDQLTQLEGVGISTAAYLRCIGLILERTEKQKNEPPAAFNFKVFSEYLTGRFDGLTTEVLELYCLDAQDRIKNSVRLTSDESDRVRINPAAITKFIITNHPYGMIVVHNHLCNNFYPSREDDSFTAQFEMLCSIHDVRLRDHIIVSPAGIFSYFLSGTLQKIKQEFNVADLYERKMT